MAELAVILGSGFSKPAGLPLVKDIKNYFLRDNKEQILHFSSGEFSWDEFASSANKTNGRLNLDHLAYGIILNYLVEVFNETVTEFNYEEFYQFVLDSLNDDSFINQLKVHSLEAFDKAFPDGKKDPTNYKDYTDRITHPQKWEIRSLINHLVADLLNVRKFAEEVEPLYASFSAFLKQYQTIDFITLNHDVLLEYLITNTTGKSISDGFTLDHNVLKSLEGNPIKMFTGDYKGDITLIKLHGSIDTYRYEKAIEKGVEVISTGEFLYYKPDNYYDKQRPYCHDPETGIKVQSFHWNVDPNFIIGTKKEEIISQSGMYKTLHDESEKRLMMCKCLLIIGYSFSDDHVNRLIFTALRESKELEKIIHVNPAIDFLYVSIRYEIIDLKNISELESL